VAGVRYLIEVGDGLTGRSLGLICPLLQGDLDAVPQVDGSGGGQGERLPLCALSAAATGIAVLPPNLYFINNGTGQVRFLNFIGNRVVLGLIGVDLAVAEGLPVV